MAYYEWPTNKYDFKPEWPQYVKNFSQKYTQEEKDIKYYRRIWN